MPTTATAQITVEHVDGEAYEIAVRDHRLRVDQPAEHGGQDAAPTPTELFVASLAACVAFYAGRYLHRHGINRDGLRVHATYTMATDRPVRVTAIHLTVQPPADLPAERTAALNAVASHCTVHNSITDNLDVSVSTVCPVPAQLPAA
jgi:putative redox protein